MGMTLHNGFVGIALLGPFVLLATAYAASAYGDAQDRTGGRGA